MVGSENRVVGKGSTMQCKKHENGSYVVEVAACLTSENTYIRPEEFGTVGDAVVKCSWGNETCVIRKADVTELGCRHNNKVYRHNQEWNSEDGTTAYACQFGKIEKRGCLIGSLLIPLYAIRYVDGNAFYCFQGTEVRSFGNLKGCTKTDGTIVPFENRAKKGDVLESCGFSFNRDGTVEFKWTQVGCIYSKEVVTVNAIQQFGEQYVHCALNGSAGYVVKLMTKEEVENWLTTTKQQWSNIVSGNEGKGTAVKREVPNPTPSSTSPAPATTITSAPTTTTTTTTPSPSTTTTTTTTTTPSPSTTTTTDAPITTTTPATTMTTTPLIKSTTSIPITSKKCVDLVEDCDKMRIHCNSDSENAKFLKEAINKFSMNLKNKSKMLEFIDHIFDEQNNRHVDQEEGKEIKCDYPRKCGRCDHRGEKHCQCKCEDHKEYNRQIVRSLCPKTCDLCNEKRAPISSILSSRTARVCERPQCDLH
uniref:ShKT domain-containing protein n=1 Tax=Caenorhabditis tropicalis TaxID=1561998 RepID=A0A1I7SZT0_9PELO